MPNSIKTPVPQPKRRKSFTILIIVLVCVFVVMPLLITAAAIAVLPSAKLCSGLVRSGIAVSALYESEPKLATYDYHCLGGTPPTAENQYTSIGVTSEANYESSDAFQNAITSKLTSAGWSAIQVSSESAADAQAVAFVKDGFTAAVTVNSYQPAYGKLKLTPTESAQTNFSFVFEKSPDVPRSLTKEQQLKYVTVPVYTSEYVPAGYSEWSVNNNPLSSASTSVTLTGGKGTVSPRMIVSAVPSGYDITADREVLTTTAGGVVVYRVATGSYKNRYDLAAIVGSNLVTLQLAYQHPHVDPQLTNDDISQILGSLKQTNTPAK